MLSYRSVRKIAVGQYCIGKPFTNPGSDRSAGSSVFATSSPGDIGGAVPLTRFPIGGEHRIRRIR